MKVSAWARTDTGRAREHNEDSFLVNDSLGLYLVADGMGGHAGGEVASRLAVEVIERELLRRREESPETFADPASDSVRDAFVQAVETASREVFARSAAEPRLHGMGTTLTGLLLQGRTAWVAHVGDSRIYLMRGGQIRLLTEDHSLVHEQMRAGLLTPEEARHSHLRNIITRSVGFEARVPVDVSKEEVREGDLFLLCSDGLSNLVDDEEMLEFAESHPPEQLPDVLVDLANARGGDDNITAVVVRVG